MAASDLVVVGTLDGLDQWTAGETDYAVGRIYIDRVLVGVPPRPSVLELRWENPSGLACPRVSHDDRVGRPALWLLKVAPDGTVRADYPRRSLPLDDLSELAQFADELKSTDRETGKVVFSWLVQWAKQQADVRRE